ncbi:hypothetical protein KR032_000286 [Drosophila birchii]|nr:hypothetical protein KR032_000286 [Drosophila birchii]
MHCDPPQPRDYQLRLVDYITKNNGIIYLPTGSGKTYVAILALKRFSQEMVKTLEDGGKRALFMCNTVELARQQAVALKRHTNFKVGFYVGEQGVDDWPRGKWTDEIRDNQVLVGTAQVILDMLTQRYLELGSVSIVIIDECHHGTGHHPYREFMRLFLYIGQNQKLPRVVGLTGVLIKGNETKQVAKSLQELETTFHGNIITVSDSKEMENVMLYSTKPKEFLMTYPSHNHSFQVVGKINEDIANFFRYLDTMNIGKQPVRRSKGLMAQRDPHKKGAIKTLFNDFQFQMKEYGIYPASIAIVSLIVEFEIKKRQAETLSLKTMYRGAIQVCEHIRHLLDAKLHDLVDEDGSVDTENVIMTFSAPKVQRFLQYLKKTFAGKQPKDICCLVFLERRYSCKCILGMLQAFINDSPELRNVLVPQFMVGRNSISKDFENVLERNQQKSAIQQFRDGEANLMVCSSVLEEGIDVQACNYVLILDALKTFNMYVQTKGRARSKEAQYVLFSSEVEKAKISQQIGQYRVAHAEIAEYLKDRVLDRSEPQIDEINEHFRDILPPFKNEHGALLLASSALILLHRYCQSLPSDAFGFVIPWITLLEERERVELFGNSAARRPVISITLPLTSRLKETIYSDPMDCVKSAKISAAFKVCKKLYLMGELNERFLPFTLKERITAIADIHFEHWKKYGDDVTSVIRRETAKTKTYKTACPAEFYDARPRVGEVCYAYEILLQPCFEQNDYTEHMYLNLQTANNYALLLRKKLPRLAEMPLFSNQGEVGVRVAETPLELVIQNEEQLELLHQFHGMLFRDILKIWQPYFVLDRRGKENSYLVVPLSTLDNGQRKGIDWQLVKNFQKLPRPQKLSVQQRKQQPAPRPEDFEGKIVTQWYANYEEKRMLVTKVHRELTPSSRMEKNHQDKTYYEFTMSKYSNHIGDVVHRDQFLIEVREITEQLNFYIQNRTKTSAQSKARAKVVLIPELCFNFSFPGDLWLKAIFLPSILRRLNFLLHAEALRKRFNAHLGLDNLPINGVNYKPKALEIDWSLKRNVDPLGNAVANEDFEEPRSLLEPLPTKSIVTDMENLKITDFENSWQEYMEPKDLSRNIMSIFPVELTYYYNFTKGHVAKIDDMEFADKKFWTETQFKMTTRNVYGTRTAPKAHNDLPALMASTSTDVPATESRLSVLQKSVSNNHITPAEQGQFLAALTSAGCSDVYDMERFELLGDSFLKLSATLYLTSKYPDWDEGTLTQVKSKLVSNRNLLYCLSETDIPTRISNSLFTPKYTWIPPSVSLPHNVLALWQENPTLAELVGPHNLRALVLSEEESLAKGTCDELTYRNFVDSCQGNVNSHYAGADFSAEVNFCVGQSTIADKVVADTLEALLGVIVKNYGLQHGFRMLEYFGVCKADIGKPLSQLLDLSLSGDKMRANVTTREIDGFLINHTHLEENLGYTFRDRGYLLQALTHPSYPTNRVTGCYQELEFVGDAILDFLISSHIFENNVKMTPGQLTDLRSALVNNTTLACICVRHKLHLFILAENALLSETIANFVSFQESQGHRVTNHVRILLEESDIQSSPLDYDDDDGDLEMTALMEASNAITLHDEPVKGEYNMSQNVDVPKALGDVLEALIAAVYLDCRDLNRTWQVIYNLFEPEIKEFSRNVPINPIRQLYEHKLANPVFSSPVVDKEKVMMSCQFTCMEKSIKVYGFGNNKDQAKMAAAKHALQKLAKCDA